MKINYIINEIIGDNFFSDQTDRVKFLHNLFVVNTITYSEALHKKSEVVHN